MAAVSSESAVVRLLRGHVEDCSTYGPNDTPFLIIASIPLDVTSHVIQIPTLDERTQAEEVQLFCERAVPAGPVSQQQCYQMLGGIIGDRQSVFHRGPEQPLHPLTKAQIISELHIISCYIFYVLTRSSLVSLARFPFTQDQQNKEEFHRFVSCIQDNLELIPRSVLKRPGGDAELLRLLQQGSRHNGPLGIDVPVIACWCGMDFYQKWYRCLQPSYFVNYETFRVVRAASQSIFASVLAELTEDEGGMDEQHARAGSVSPG